jgi:hypothetical protein
MWKSAQLIRRVWVGSTLILSNWLLNYVHNSNNKLAMFSLLTMCTTTLSYVETEWEHWNLFAATHTKQNDAVVSAHEHDFDTNKEIAFKIGHALQETLFFLFVQYVMTILNSIDISTAPLYEAIILILTVGTFGYTIVQKASMRRN